MSAWAVALVVAAGWAGWEAGVHAGRRDVLLAVEAVDRDWRRNVLVLQRSGDLVTAVRGKLQGMRRVPS